MASQLIYIELKCKTSIEYLLIYLIDYNQGTDHKIISWQNKEKYYD